MKAMPPPVASAEQLASRLFLGPALRTQSDRRLVTLVRDGYEAAFEEIVRRYRKPLDRFAASFVGGRSEDVTQDAFSKALLALRGSEQEIELRPWLYRIVRNTALNDLRDSPPPTAELGEAMAGARSAAEEVERREELTELADRLRALPDPQRAAIVMRELEGLSHEEIAAALGMSGGAARQAIYRGRQALRDGFGLLLPLPLLRLLAEHGTEAAAGAGAGGAIAAGAAGTAGALGGASAGGALKVGLATVLIAGSVGAGVAVEQRGRHDDSGQAASAPAEIARSEADGSDSGNAGGSGPGPGLSASSDAGSAGSDRGEGRRSSGHGGGDGRGAGNDGDRGPAVGSGEGSGEGFGAGDPSGRGHGEPGPSDDGGHEDRRHEPGSDGGSGRGGGRGPSPEGDHSGSGSSGSGTRSGGGSTGDGNSGGGHSGSGGGHPGSGSGGSSGGGEPGSNGSSGSGSSGSPVNPPPPPPPPPEEEPMTPGSGDGKGS
jgi:RNA polymerase sigma factor (sigma-70 family)